MKRAEDAWPTRQPRHSRTVWSLESRFTRVRFFFLVQRGDLSSIGHLLALFHHRILLRTPARLPTTLTKIPPSNTVKPPRPHLLTYRIHRTNSLHVVREDHVSRASTSIHIYICVSSSSGDYSAQLASILHYCMKVC